MSRAQRFVLAFCLLCLPAPAFADATIFLGANTTPSNRTVKGGAIGVVLVIVGFEFEYANTSEDLANGAPSLHTFMGNAIVQTIPISGLQFYGTAGGGAYHERLDTQTTNNFGINIGGGVKISLLGPVKLRVDYRVFKLSGSPLYSNPKRIYAGLTLTF